MCPRRLSAVSLSASFKQPKPEVSVQTYLNFWCSTRYSANTGIATIIMPNLPPSCCGLNFMPWLGSEQHGSGTVFWLVRAGKKLFLSFSPSSLLVVISQVPKGQMWASWWLWDVGGWVWSSFHKVYLQMPCIHQGKVFSRIHHPSCLLCYPTDWGYFVYLPGKVDISRVRNFLFPLKTEWWSKKKKREREREISLGLEPQPWTFKLNDLGHQFPYLQNGY